MYNSSMFKILTSFLIFLSHVYAANWPMIQGTEKAVDHHPWGFLQIRVQDNSGNIAVKNGINKTPFSYIKPTLTQQSELQVARARLGLRGSLDDANKINYFLLTEFAPSGVNNPLSERMHNYVVDASITLKYFPIYLRAGRFKYAGSEEGNMARFTSPFIMFSNVGDQLMLERFTDTRLDKPSEGVGAFRDTGLQLFQSFSLDTSSSLTLSYMIGNGSGLANENINGGKYTHYGFLAYENILGKGKGYRQESLKLYTWYQEGKRQLYENGLPTLYDRIRYGTGITYFYENLRFEAEYIKAKGMLFTGSKDTNTNPVQQNWKFSIAPEKENEADGYYILSTYGLFKKLDIIARYEKYNRMTNKRLYLRKFETITTGFSYKFQGYDRIDVNYAINSAKAPYNKNANDILNATGNLLSVQYTVVFK